MRQTLTRCCLPSLAGRSPVTVLVKRAVEQETPLRVVVAPQIATPLIPAVVTSIVSTVEGYSRYACIPMEDVPKGISVSMVERSLVSYLIRRFILGR